ncbi:hypothetical protein QR98_0061670 [Sarcoptes scabiei]|uniref:Uncharacterized protein n=1 Tax=Sarcoptes scabiei TaxID=52283 RepID=A0A132A9P2_SARSC|nr:hypothetical protein QR98_0061670 [Sarcoptes scabiei]
MIVIHSLQILVVGGDGNCEVFGGDGLGRKHENGAECEKQFSIACISMKSVFKNIAPRFL